MKILSSDISTNVHTTRESDFTYSSKRETSFKSLLFKPNEKLHEHMIEKPSQQRLVIHDEKNLPIRDLINKFIIEMLLAKYLGREEKEVKIYPYENCDCNHEPKQNTNNKTIAQTQVKFSLEENYEYFKKNSIEFGTKAVIKTADKDIDIDLNVSYTQEFYESYKKELNFEKTVFVDPLIIHYDLSSNYFDSISKELTFKFDINSNEEEVTIPVLKEGSGFLALDRNNNGVIDNGSELFGPKTNKGFEELKEFDKDNNNWIDENDTVFNNLKIWNKNEKGEDTLVTLSDANIGAIYLADTKSEFNYDKSINERLAHLKSTSMFLTEDGKAGLVTGVNFALS